MSKKVFLIFLFLTQSLVYGHNLFMNVYDNEDNTIFIEGFFSTGEAAIGAQIRLEALATGEVLYKKRLPIENELTIQIPIEPYTIILDGGPQHQIEKEGIPPLGGFLKEISKTEKEIKEIKIKEKEVGIKKITIILIGIIVALTLLSLTIVICAKNTNKLISRLEENKQ